MANQAGRIPHEDSLAYYLTWTAYGSWLPGDEHRWVGKPGEFRGPDAKRKESAQCLMTDSALSLDAEQRRVVEDTIAAHCRVRCWRLHAVNCRTQHVHVVVTAPGCKPVIVMNQFKSWCTRRLKELEQTRRPTERTVRQNWWTQRGSKRWLNDEDSLEAAIRYVLEAQGEPTPRPLNSPLHDRQA